MKQNTDGNGRINNTQRRVLANLAVEILSAKVQQARDDSGELVAQIKQKVREALGIAAMDIEDAKMASNRGGGRPIRSGRGEEGIRGRKMAVDIDKLWAEKISNKAITGMIYK